MKYARTTNKTKQRIKNMKRKKSKLCELSKNVTLKHIKWVWMKKGNIVLSFSKEEHNCLSFTISIIIWSWTNHEPVGYLRS